MNTPIETLAIKKADQMAETYNMPDNDHDLTKKEIPQIEESPLEKKINWIAGQSIGSTFAEELLEHFLDAPGLITSRRIEEWVETK